MANTPLSSLPFTGYNITVAVNAVVELDPAPFSNTKEIVINNLSTADLLLVQVADYGRNAPLVIPLIAAVTTANSTIVPFGASFSFCIGSEGSRIQLATLAFWQATPGANCNIVLGNPGGAGAIDVNVTFVQCAGGGGLTGGC